MNEKDIAFLLNLAGRLSAALYNGTVEPIGSKGSVSPGLTHDDYDRLRAIAAASCEHVAVSRSASPPGWACSKCGAKFAKADKP